MKEQKSVVMLFNTSSCSLFILKKVFLQGNGIEFAPLPQNKQQQQQPQQQNKQTNRQNSPA